MVVRHRSVRVHRPHPASPAPAGRPGVLDRDGTEVDSIEQALARLPERQRTALLLCDRAGLGYQEVAQAVGCTPAAAKVLIHRARVAFRSYYTENSA